MKYFKLFLTALTVSVMFISCTRIEEQADFAGSEHLFSVSAELASIEQEEEESEEPDTKGYLGSFIRASWDIGDKISVVNLTSGKVLGGNLTTSESGNRATFNGTVTGTINAGDVLSMLYPPFENTEEVDFETRTINFAEQYKTSKVPLVAHCEFTADKADGIFSNLNLNFYYVLSYLKISMANLPANVNVSKITLRNIPDQVSLSINNAKNGFDVATADEKSALKKIELEGSYSTDNKGSFSVSVGVMPSDASNLRTIVVTTENGDYLSPFASAALQSHKYYNTIASQFELINISGKDKYGIYDLENLEVIDSYEDIISTVITGQEGNEADFTLLNQFSSNFWTIKGIPFDAAEGTSFTARFYSNGAGLPSTSVLENARIHLLEPDGDFSKLWIKAGNTLFIVRKQ